MLLFLLPPCTVQGENWIVSFNFEDGTTDAFLELVIISGAMVLCRDVLYSYSRLVEFNTSADVKRRKLPLF